MNLQFLCMTYLIICLKLNHNPLQIISPRCVMIHQSNDTLMYHYTTLVILMVVLLIINYSIEEILTFVHVQHWLVQEIVNWCISTLLPIIPN